ncbi:MAG: putative Ig domain-containing protein [Candidatus Sulfopaludibacter sp.]|nr:putative Ig domain-containing protein [Candidatus Sulfopaludibacter sp.]
MRRISPLLFLSTLTLALLHAQPTITSLQSSNTYIPTFGAAITSGGLGEQASFTLFVNGSFSAGNVTKVEWTNTVTHVVQDFLPSNGINSVSSSQISVNVPLQGTNGSLWGTVVSSAQAVNITVFQGSAVSNAAVFIVNPPLAPPLSDVLPAGTTGQPYSATMFSGGTAPYDVSLADVPNPGSLPPGLNFPTSTTLSGTPTQAGLYTYAVQIYDEWGNSLLCYQTIEIVDPPTISSVVPNSAIAGSNAVPITVTGTHFVSPTTQLDSNYAGSTIELVYSGPSAGLVPLATTVLNATTATATIPAAYLAAAQQLGVLILQPSGARSNSLPFTILGPTVTSVTPSTVTARPTAVALTVTGANFLANGFGTPGQSTIVIGGSPASTAFGSGSLSTTAVFATAGIVPIQVENPGGSLSNTVNVSVLATPSITSVTPNPFPGGQLTVNGSNFTATMAVLFNGAAIPTSFVNAGQLLGTVPASLYVGTTALVSVETADYYITPAVKINLGTPIQITTTSIPLAVAGQPYDAKLAATGGFTPYTWTATGLPQGLSINPATGEITGTPTAFSGSTISVTVTDVDNYTATAQFQIVGGPTITAISPNFAPAGSNAVPITITGTNFVAGSVIAINVVGTGTGFSPLSTTIVSTTSATASIPASNLTKPQQLALVVMQPSEAQSNSVTFTVQAPTLTAVSPNSAPAGSNAVPIAATGTNFVTGSVIAINVVGTDTGFTQLPTSIGGSTSATASIPASFLTTPQQLAVAVIQPGGSQSNPVTFTVQAPAISTVAPSTVTARTTPTAMTVSGSGFLSSGSAAPAQSSILVSGSPVTTTFVSSTSLTASVTLSTAGTIPFQVQNPAGSTSNTVNVTVLPAPAITSVTPNPYPGGKLTVNGSNFSATMTALFNGTAIPTSFVSATQLTGTVPASMIAGATALIAVQTTDNYVTSPFKINLNTPQITTTSIPAATGLQPYDAKLAVTGGTPPYLWSAGGLPQGLSINPATGEISGTPTSFGTFNISVAVTDANGLSASARYSAPVSTPAPAPQLGSGSPPAGFVNVSYNYSFNATGGNGNVSFGLGTGSVPPGLILDNSGVLKGQPTTAGTYNFSVVVTDADGLNSSVSFTMLIKPQPLSITTPAPLASVAMGSPVSIKFAALGGVPPYTFSATGTLPPGTSLAGDGTLSGTPTTPGTYSFGIVVSDSVQSQPGSRSFSLTVNTSALTATATLGNGQVGVAYTGQIGATGGTPPYTFAVSGLPDGLSFANGTVSGTPTTAGQSTVSVTVTDSVKATATQSFPITITAGALTVTTSSLPDGAVSVAYSAGLAASGGSGKYSWAVSGLPDGLSVSSTGAISGTPTKAGTFPVTATVTDTAVSVAVISASKSFSITIAVAPLSITTGSLANPTAGTAYSASVAATGGVPPYTFSATGLPAGLSISSGGAITGTTTAPGSASVSVTVKDSAGTTASHSFQLTVALPPAPTLNVTGLPTTSTPATQSTVTIGIGTAYPVDVTVTLTLTFAADSGPDDPTVQFSTGGRTAQLTIPAGSTTASATIGVQIGTVAGTATITAHLLAGTTDITPSPAPTRTVRVNSVAPVITSVTAASTSGGFTVTVIGFATSRSMTQAVFTFTPSSGVNLQTTSVTIPATSLFATWYSSSASAPFGSQFSLTQPFTVSGGTSAVASVSVVLTNGDGSSAPVSGTVH